MLKVYDPLMGGHKGSNGRKSDTAGKKAAYTAAAAALAVLMIVITAYLPVTVMPLVCISLCFNIVNDKCGPGYCVAAMLISLILGFILCFSQLGVLIIVAVVFIPYSAVCMILKKYDYSSMKGFILRSCSLFALASISMFACYLLAGYISDFINLELIFGRFNNGIAGYLILNIILIIGEIAVDYIYLAVAKIILPKLK